ncbi:Spermatogenesis-associated protein 13 (APC-stimulated guanine nucleotide exchange factor 2) (Asef2) [Durusdinium trenchii]|uniref:Spermatogenesis-associated protein 13 (APC-stimulated guanine nucleotide exchange factor 2) (Asef2) n=1 Tax=Durusdinium trenchii TaxID=1381693 RepID=A0ABP0IPV4_9DINO
MLLYELEWGGGDDVVDFAARLLRPRAGADKCVVARNGSFAPSQHAGRLQNSGGLQSHAAALQTDSPAKMKDLTNTLAVHNRGLGRAPGKKQVTSAPPHGEPSDEQQPKWKLVCQEIGDTEKAFAGHLDTLLESFVPAISAVVTRPEDLRVLFGNVRQLREFSVVFQADLDAALESDDVAHAIAALYNSTAPFFRLYSTYCQTHGEAQELVVNMLANKSFRTVVDDCEKEAGQSLLSLLIMPIQRVPRHVLLLRTLRDALPNASHTLPQQLAQLLGGKVADPKAACEAAITKMQDVAATINESIRERENAVKIWEIQHNLVLDSGSGSGDSSATSPSILFETHRVFKMEGELLMVYGRKHKKKRKCFLFNDCLVVAKSSGLKRKKWQLVEKVAAQQVQDLVDDSALTLGTSNALLVGCGEDHTALVLIADSAETKAQWLAAFRQVVPQGPLRIARTPSPAASSGRKGHGGPLMQGLVAWGLAVCMCTAAWRFTAALLVCLCMVLKATASRTRTVFPALTDPGRAVDLSDDASTCRAEIDGRVVAPSAEQKLPASAS